MKIFADWDWSGAGEEFQKAIALNPNYAVAHAEYGHKILSAIMGRYDDALAELQRAQELDPLSVQISTQIGWVYHHTRAAMGSVQRAVPEDPRIGVEVAPAIPRLGTKGDLT